MTGPYLPRGLIRAGAAVTFAVVFGLLYAVADPAQAGSVLFVVPVAMLALSDGQRGGAIGAFVASLLVGTWVLTDDIHLNVLGWGSRIVGFAVVGILVGRYEDLARRHERGRLDERYAAELHDRVVQALVVARYRLEGQPEAQRAVDEALDAAKDIISSRLAPPAPGDLRIRGEDPSAGPPR